MEATAVTELTIMGSTLVSPIARWRLNLSPVLLLSLPWWDSEDVANSENVPPSYPVSESGLLD